MEYMNIYPCTYRERNCVAKRGECCICVKNCGPNTAFFVPIKSYLFGERDTTVTISRFCPFELQAKVQIIWGVARYDIHAGEHNLHKWEVMTEAILITRF